MSGLNDATIVTIKEIQFFERDVVFRLPFRFGIVTLTKCPQAYARVLVRSSNGCEKWGVSAEMLAPKWFDKNPGLSNEDNINQLRNSLFNAAKLYSALGKRTPFEFHRDTYDEQIRDSHVKGDGPLVACFGPALIDRAILDAVCKSNNVSFYRALRSNLPGIEEELCDMSDFLSRLFPRPSIDVRHTIGLSDPIESNPNPISDGLPETLIQVIDAYGHRYFKVKVSGNIEADIDRLLRIAAVLDSMPDCYFISLDGNEQYKNVADVLELLDMMKEEPKLSRFESSIIFIEQPIARSVALETDISRISIRKPVIIDESDSMRNSFVRARQLGYRGVSTKTCKGLYKSILNAARCVVWGDGSFMSAEDLTTQAGVSVQQDMALANLLGIRHVERNGHHYVRGMNGIPVSEQKALFSEHPDIYEEDGDIIRLRINNGRVAIGSLDRPGFAISASLDFSDMKEMVNGRSKPIVDKSGYYS